jgi:hypothetical protein
MLAATTTHQTTSWRPCSATGLPARQTEIPGPNPPTAGWPFGASDVWTPDLWSSDYTFTDSLYAVDCYGAWRPQPFRPSGLTSLVVSNSQSVYVGSSTNGSGKLVQSATQQFYTDHGDVN